MSILSERRSASGWGQVSGLHRALSRLSFSPFTPLLPLFLP